jgi:hypothetical protein
MSVYVRGTPYPKLIHLHTYNPCIISSFAPVVVPENYAQSMGNIYAPLQQYTYAPVTHIITPLEYRHLKEHNNRYSMHDTILLTIETLPGRPTSLMTLMHTNPGASPLGGCTAKFSNVMLGHGAAELHSMSTTAAESPTERDRARNASILTLARLRCSGEVGEGYIAIAQPRRHIAAGSRADSLSLSVVMSKCMC